MAILGSATSVAAKVGRAKSNAITVELKNDAGADIGSARQKGGAAVLFGFKNGGGGEYTLTAGSDELVIAVGGTTTISRNGTTIGKIVPSDGAVRFEDGGGTVLGAVRPYAGKKSDDPWVHQLVSPQGAELGALNLTRSHTTLMDAYDDIFLADTVYSTRKLPSAGTMLQLHAPVHDVLGDVLVAACVDFAVLPRGYLAS